MKHKVKKEWRLFLGGTTLLILCGSLCLLMFGYCFGHICPVDESYNHTHGIRGLFMISEFDFAKRFCGCLSVMVFFPYIYKPISDFLLEGENHD